MKRSQPGYYPGYQTLAQKSYWDAATRKTVEDRLNKTGSFRFFAPDQARLLEAVCARLLPQDDRDAALRIPIAPGIDDRLFRNQSDGYRHENMPPDGEAYRLGLNGIDQIAGHLHGRGFADLDPGAQDEILESLHAGKPAAAEDIWKQLPVHRFFLLALQDCIDEYYSHPWAWDEIGYGGPAYPRAYMRLEGGQPEPWERPEERREWTSPGSGLSEKFANLAGLAEHLGGPQGGTH
jgi:Gluconate 2-dehydrogenase subunit 3